MDTASFVSSVERVVSVIRDCPDWMALRADDTERRAETVKLLQTISQVPTDVLRAAVAHISDHKNPSYVSEHKNAIFVLNRLVFNVPRFSSEHVERFASFVEVPFDEEKGLDLIWPLEISSDGQFVLGGEFRGYFGYGYMALSEFDYFLKEFGRRQSARVLQ